MMLRDEKKVEKHCAGVQVSTLAQAFTLEHKIIQLPHTEQRGAKAGLQTSVCFSTAGPRPGTGPWHQL
jgi:hypothetical protein